MALSGPFKEDLSTPLSSRPSLLSCCLPGHRWYHVLLQAIVRVMLFSRPSLLSCSPPGHRWCRVLLQAIVGVVLSSRPSLVSCYPPGHLWCDVQGFGPAGGGPSSSALVRFPDPRHDARFARQSICSVIIPPTSSVTPPPPFFLGGD